MTQCPHLTRQIPMFWKEYRTTAVNCQNMSDNINPLIFLDAAIQECFNGKYLVSRVHFHVVTYVCKLMSFIRKNRSISISIQVRILSLIYRWFLLSKKFPKCSFICEILRNLTTLFRVKWLMIKLSSIQFPSIFWGIRSVAELLPSYLYINECILEGDI